MIGSASGKHLGDRYPLRTILIGSLVVGPLLGLIQLYLGGALLRLTGGWFDGKASSVHLRSAIAWSSLPIVAVLPVWMFYFTLFGKELFTTATPTVEVHLSLAWMLVVIGMVSVVLLVWRFVLLFECVAEVHGFSIWKALGASLLALLVAIGIAIGVVVCIYLPLFLVWHGGK